VSDFTTKCTTYNVYIDRGSFRTSFDPHFAKNVRENDFYIFVPSGLDLLTFNSLSDLLVSRVMSPRSLKFIRLSNFESKSQARDGQTGGHTDGVQHLCGQACTESHIIKE